MEALVEALSRASAGVAIAPARALDLEAASAVLVEAARWLIGRDMPLWPPDELAPVRLLPLLGSGELLLARQDDEIVGTLALAWEDPDVWPDVPPGEAAYLHKLAVRRRVAGTGVADALLADARSRALAAGRLLLRLDCSVLHPGLGRYYRARGFERHSEWQLGPYRVERHQQVLA